MIYQFLFYDWTGALFDAILLFFLMKFNGKIEFDLAFEVKYIEMIRLLK